MDSAVETVIAESVEAPVNHGRAAIRRSAAAASTAGAK